MSSRLFVAESQIGCEMNLKFRVTSLGKDEVGDVIRILARRLLPMKIVHNCQLAMAFMCH